MKRALLSLNAGSSSIKFALFTVEPEGGLHRVAGGKIEAIGIAPRFRAQDAQGKQIADRTWADGAALTHSALLQEMLHWAGDLIDDYRLIGVGHRVVHGGGRFHAPQIVDDPLLEALDALCPLAPLHQPHNLAAIRALRTLLPDVPQIASFDTGFHHEMPPLATRFGLPRALHDKGIRRYGFHGVSYEYIARTLAELDPALARGRVIAAHLGNGASMCAMREGKSIDTTMGFTALDGLLMGTRCGAIDPGAVLHLQAHEGLSAAEVEDLLYERSGLLGVSGVSSDMRALSASEDPRAEEAIALFAWRAAREAGALISSLGGLDGLVFTAGIGENHADVRRRICQRLAWTGLELDEAANQRHAPVISAPASTVATRIIATDEERMIALHMLDLLARLRASKAG